MKKLFVMLMFAGLCLCSAATAQAAISDLGQVCFFMTQSPAFSAGPGGTLRVGILSYGTGYFVVTGKITGTDVPTGPVHGTAVVDGNNIVISLVNSDSDMKLPSSEPTAAGRFSSIHISLDMSTLKGRFTNMNFNYNGESGQPPDVHGGPIEVMQCP